MPKPDPATLTQRQRKWFASVREGLERETGRTLAEWAELARACPQTGHRARLAWMKAKHGLAQNRASMVLNAAFPGVESWATPDLLADKLWTDPTAAAIFQRVRLLAEALPDIVTGQRKGFTAFSRRTQFAAARPSKSHVLLGLALAPDHDPRLSASKREAWSERLTSVLALRAPEDVDLSVRDLLLAAWGAS